VKRLVIEYWTPLVLWLAVMFFFSTDMFSSGETSRVIVPILTFFFPGASPPALQFWHAAIRKFGHVTEYFFLAVLSYRSLKRERPDFAYTALQVVYLAAVVAAVDEFHQSLTQYRTASPVDIGYDCLGAVTAVWLIGLYETRHLSTHSVL
jgi:VanZ family protein